MKKVLILARKAPYGMVYTIEGFLAAMAMTSMGLPTDFVLLEDGVYCAVKGQNPEGIGHQTIQLALEGASGLGVKLSIHKASLDERGLKEKELVPAEFVDDEALARMVKEASAVMTF